MSVLDDIARLSDSSGGPHACWPWLGPKTRRGFPMVRVDGVNRPVRRHWWLERVGPLEPGRVATFSCQNNWCVNPAHFTLGFRHASIEQRFWTYVKKADGDACWEWQGQREKGANKGYGRLQAGRKAPEQAHRVSWRIHHGAIPDGFIVCHHCDNPPCVRPDHLFLGTSLDNTTDMIAKGRKPMKIDAARRAELAADRRAGMSYNDLCAKYLIAAGTVYKHLRRAGVTGESPPSSQAGEKK